MYIVRIECFRYNIGNSHYLFFHHMCTTFSNNIFHRQGGTAAGTDRGSSLFIRCRCVNNVWPILILSMKGSHFFFFFEMLGREAFCVCGLISTYLGSIAVATNCYRLALASRIMKSVRIKVSPKDVIALRTFLSPLSLLDIWLWLGIHNSVFAYLESV